MLCVGKSLRNKICNAYVGGFMFNLKQIALSFLLLFSVARVLASDEQLLRDVSWLPYVLYNNSKYGVSKLSEQGEKNNFKDKISINEVERSKNIIMSFLCTYIIPEEWNILATSKKIHYMDPTDALALAALDGNLEIALVAEKTFPFSKAIIESGKTSDFKNKDDVVAAPINVDHYIALAIDTLEENINTYRVTKGALVGAALVSRLFDWKKVFESFGEYVGFPLKLADNSSQSPAQSTVTESAGWIKEGSAWVAQHKAVLAGVSLFGFMTLKTHLKQNKMIKDYLSVVDFLMHSKKFSFTKKAVLVRLIKLRGKILQFGFGNAHADYIQKIILSV